MYRVVNAKQLIGSIFIELFNRQKNSISLENIFQIEKKIDQNLRRRSNAITLMSIEDIYQVVYSYENIFKLEPNEVSIQKYNSNLENMKMLFDDYFVSGIPKDIAQVISTCVKECLKNER